MSKYLVVLSMIFINASDAFSQDVWQKKYIIIVDKYAKLEVEKEAWVRKYNEKVAEIAQLRTEKREFVNKIASLTAEIALLKRKLEKNAPSTIKIDSQSGIISGLKSEKRKLEKDNKELELARNKDKILRGQQTYSTDSIKSLLSEARREFETANAELIAIKKEYQKLQNDYTDIKNKYDELYKCLNTFCDSVQSQLAIANEAYESYKTYKYKDTTKRKAFFNVAWTIYKAIYYDNIPNSICFLAKKDCLGKNPEACTNISGILIYNHENVVEELGSTTSEQLNRRTEMILSALSLVIKDGNNAGRKQAIENLGALPRILFQDENSTSSGMTAKLNKIRIDYDKGDFNSALSEFDRVYYLLSMKEISNIGEPVLEAKYCAGMILLWELADIKAINSWAIHGSWLKSVKTSDTKSVANNTAANKPIDNIGKGKELLKEVLIATKNEPLKKEIRYALSKFPLL
jgi:predicted  nucleic acid-binding Zn-ribbon protein